MSYVQRDSGGNICGVYANLQPGIAEESVSETDPALMSFLASLNPPSILSQDLMAQFTAVDATAIQAAISGNVQFWLLWSAMQAQKDPMVVTNARFLAGWNALVQVLGEPRMTAIATSLGVTI